MNKPRMHLREGAHQSVVRSAAIWTPIFITSTALSVAFALIALDSPGAWVSFAIAALVALLSGVSALGALRDIYAEPILTTGVIQRKWRKSDAFIFRGHYILCQKRVFRIPRKIYDELPAAEFRERQEFAYEACDMMRRRTLNAELWPRFGIENAEIEALLPRQSSQQALQRLLFSKIVPNCKKLGLLDHRDGWLRERFQEMGIIQYEDLSLIHI